MGHSFKIGLVLALSVIVITGFSQEAFSGSSFPSCITLPLQDRLDIGNAEIVEVDLGTLSLAELTGAFCIVFGTGTGFGIIERTFTSFPHNGAIETLTQTVTNDGTDPITSYKQTNFRDGTNDKGNWESAMITLQDSSTCSVTKATGTFTCGDITITISASGPSITPAGTTDVVVFEFHNNPQGNGDSFIIQNDLSHLAVVTGGVLTMNIHDLANTEPAPQVAVGSISIPIDSTPMLVAGSEMNSIWITLAIISVVGIGILIIRRN